MDLVTLLTNIHEIIIKAPDNSGSPHPIYCITAANFIKLVFVFFSQNILAVIWGCVETLNKIITAIPNKQFVINRLRVLPILTDMWPISTQITTTECILKMLHDLTFGIQITIVEPFMEKLIQKAIKIVISQNAQQNEVRIPFTLGRDSTKFNAIKSHHKSISVDAQNNSLHSYKCVQQQHGHFIVFFARNQFCRFPETSFHWSLWHFGEFQLIEIDPFPSYAKEIDIFCWNSLGVQNESHIKWLWTCAQRCWLTEFSIICIEWSFEMHAVSVKCKNEAKIKGQITIDFHSKSRRKQDEISLKHLIGFLKDMATRQNTRHVLHEYNFQEEFVETIKVSMSIHDITNDVCLPFTHFWPFADFSCWMIIRTATVVPCTFPACSNWVASF